MNRKTLGTENNTTTLDRGKVEKTYPRPSWVKSGEEELCPDCFKVVGDRSRYNLVCMLGKSKEGITVNELTKMIKLTQPTVTHHLKVLKSVDAVKIQPRGRERVYTLNRSAHCFEECHIPY